MKTITLLLFIIISLSSFSQDARIFEQTWILHDLILDGQSNIPPINSEQNHIPADFIETNEFTTGVCDGTGGFGFITYNGTAEFSFPEGIGWLAGGCSLYENELYSNLYGSFWEPSYTETFQYEIIENTQERTLIVTAPDGDKAIYSNMFLSVNEFKNESILVSPIPAGDILNLKYNKDVLINSLRIYDTQGKQVLQITKNFSEINIEELKSGLYFILAEDNEYKNLTRKFIKR